ncbi:MAG: dual specificity protein phosphatase family protein [Terriglobales bacterium]|jgi:tyrosine-protein phosphatase SIW14
MTMIRMSGVLRALTVFLSLVVSSTQGPICRAEEPQHDTSRDSTGKGARVIGEKQKVAGVPNFGKVTLTLLRGGQPSQKGFETLSKMGVDIVVDARGKRDKSEGKIVKGLGMQYVSIPWHCPLPHDDVFAQFLKLLEDNPDKKVFVHCRLGDDRTGMMVASYRMAVEGWSADEAMLEMQHFGFTPEHHFICPRLAPYEKSFPKRLKNNPAFERLH